MHACWFTPQLCIKLCLRFVTITLHVRKYYFEFIYIFETRTKILNKNVTSMKKDKHRLDSLIAVWNIQNSSDYSNLTDTFHLYCSFFHTIWPRYHVYGTIRIIYLSVNQHWYHSRYKRFRKIWIHTHGLCFSFFPFFFFFFKHKRSEWSFRSIRVLLLSSDYRRYSYVYLTRFIEIHSILTDVSLEQISFQLSFMVFFYIQRKNIIEECSIKNEIALKPGAKTVFLHRVNFCTENLDRG